VTNTRNSCAGDRVIVATCQECLAGGFVSTAAAPAGLMEGIAGAGETPPDMEVMLPTGTTLLAMAMALWAPVSVPRGSSPVPRNGRGGNPRPPRRPRGLVPAPRGRPHPRFARTAGESLGPSAVPGVEILAGALLPST
jgi:hypothetical protein